MCFNDTGEFPHTYIILDYTIFFFWVILIYHTCARFRLEQVYGHCDPQFCARMTDMPNQEGLSLIHATETMAFWLAGSSWISYFLKFLMPSSADSLRH